MKALQICILSLFAISVAADITYIDTHPLFVTQAASHANLVYGIKSYLGPVSNVHVTYPEYSWQLNIHQVDPDYQYLVRNIIYTRPISQWPLVVRYLVYPQIYGYYTSDVLKSYLAKLKEHELTLNQKIGEKDFDFNAAGANLGDDDGQKLDLLEKLSRLESLKKEVDHNLILQTQDLLEAKKYGEQVNKLIEKLDEVSKNAKAMDKILKAVK